ncbi:hypothetical protein J437_LFUL017618 [Ladona fulva]|uniref:Carboxylesterase type B domain-containing protein n=1 Tax=Ladona fulva TaxID=123851 RepID=A0A8K0KPH0_LADFU|nr:hypothetical protein J437_LFUL017618 [Ladona fulva]
MKRRSYSWLSVVVMAIILGVNIEAVELELSSEVVELDVGKLQGSIFTTSKGRKVLAFLGIPYAKAPLNELRFMPTKPHEGWSGIKNATTDGNVCPQIHVLTGKYVGDEDCLFLNVFTPKIVKNDMEEKLPVMVWIHGGLFIAGSGNTDWFGPQYFLDEDIVTGDKASPGNYGLKDQVTALKWVKDYISKFGGDSRRITIFGNDAGAASVHYHILSPMSKGLFHRGISQSGSALNPWALTFKGKTHAWNLAELLACDLDDNTYNMIYDTPQRSEVYRNDIYFNFPASIGYKVRGIDMENIMKEAKELIGYDKSVRKKKPWMTYAMIKKWKREGKLKRQ